MSDPLEPRGESVDADELFPEQELPEARIKRQVTARGAAIAGARVVVGLVGLGVAVLTIGGAALIPFPSVRSTPPSQLIEPVPTAQQLVCPGAVLRLADEAGEGATTSSALGAPTISSDASTGTVDSSAFSQSDAATGGTREAPTLISTPPSDSGDTEPPLLSGAQAQLVAEGEYVGLAAASCEVASGEAWLVGGSTTVGRTTLLTLSNPTEVPATVDLTLYGESGQISAPGTSGIVVAPRGQRVLSLAGFRPDVLSPVVRVASRGGLVVADLQQSLVRGLVAGGVDVVGSTAPSTENVILGVVIADPAAVQPLLGGGAAFEDVRTVLRLFAPGEEGTEATVRVIPEGGTETGNSFQFSLEAGRVAEVPLDELASGSYTVRVETAVPVVAAVRVTAAAGESTDFAWATAAPVLTGSAQVTVANGPGPLLHLHNPAAEPVTVLVGDVPVEVPGGGFATVPVEGGRSILLTGFERLYAAVSFVDAGMIAHYTVPPPGVSSGPIVIYP
jgi:hypothetical protein